MRRPSDNERAFAEYLDNLTGRQRTERSRNGQEGDGQEDEHPVKRGRESRGKPNRSALATLRRGISGRPEVTFWLDRYIRPFIPSRATPWQERCYYLVAALFATHQGTWPTDDTDERDRNLGASLAGLVRRESQRVHAESGGVERRFIALLSSHQDDLDVHLRHVISLLASRDVPVDWALLLCQIKHWDREDREVQRSWARSFWGGGLPVTNQEMASAGDG
ncbi:MAG: type I-E CRISPR-associated protein Cse2/CasB [Firmicutes bacterium]|nr:type I-E CRISPR-associated protein Cse2/CasB [Bacillota bacterium]